MPSTLHALGILVLAFLPGGVYIWSFEQQAGSWNAAASDRIYRFIAASAILQVLALPGIYQLWRLYGRTGAIRDGHALPRWFWLLPLAYLALPLLAGRIIGSAARKRKVWSRCVTGPAPAPRAWDQLFGTADLAGWVRIKLKDGGWLGGAYGGSPGGQLTSYAAGYPHPQDLFLTATALMDTEGDFVLDAAGRPQLKEAGLLIRWDEISYLHFEIIGGTT